MAAYAECLLHDRFREGSCKFIWIDSEARTCAEDYYRGFVIVVVSDVCEYDTRTESLLQGGRLPGVLTTTGLDRLCTP